MRISDWSSDVCSSDLVALLHIVNNLAVPASFAGTKSYSLFSGVQDAMTQWWYGHNAVAFFLTAGFLGMLYYYLPKRAGRPIYSYRMSIIGFWGITFFYIWRSDERRVGKECDRTC